MKQKPLHYNYLLEKDGVKFICFGIVHTSNNNHPQFNEIKNVIKSFKPNAIVFELSSKGLYALNQKENKILRKHSSEIDIIYEMFDENVEIIAGDLNFEEALSNLKDNRYTKNEKLALVLLLKAKNKSEKIYLRPVDYIEKELDLKKNESKREVINIINSHLKNAIGRVLDEVTHDDNYVPNPISNYSKLNKLMRLVSIKRDENMIDKIKSALITHNRLIFFVGRNHAIRQEEYWKEFFT